MSPPWFYRQNFFYLPFSLNRSASLREGPFNPSPMPRAYFNAQAAIIIVLGSGF